jgi:hypothetical protein
MRKAPATLLEIRIDGPGVKPGRIELSILVKICREVQEAVNRQAQAIESKATGKPIREEAVARECRLELIELREGSTVLAFAPASKQLALIPHLESLGIEAVTAVASALRAVNQTRGHWQPPDPRVLESLEKLGDIFDEGVSRLEWIAPAHGGRKAETVEFVPSALPRIRRRKQEALPLQPAELKQPPSTAARNAAPSPVQESILGEDPGSRSVSSPRLQTRRKDSSLPFDAAAFFADKTIEQLRMEQGAPAVTDIDSLEPFIPEEDLDEFIAEIYRDREASVA